jgi:hypothetical protein
MSNRQPGASVPAQGDQLSSIHLVWLAADVLLVAGVFGFVLLGFLDLIPFGLGFGLSFVFVILLFRLDILQRRWLVKEFERLIRRPTWGAATAGALASPHMGSCRCSGLRVVLPAESPGGQRRW